MLEEPWIICECSCPSTSLSFHPERARSTRRHSARRAEPVMCHDLVYGIHGTHRSPPTDRLFNRRRLKHVRLRSDGRRVLRSLSLPREIPMNEVIPFNLPTIEEEEI